MNNIDDAPTGTPEPPDSGLADPDKRADLRRMAQQHEDAIAGTSKADGRSSRSMMSMQIGPKAEIEDRLHELSSQGLRSGQTVPYGTVAEGGGRLIFAAFAVIVLGAVGLLALLWWFMS